MEVRQATRDQTGWFQTFTREMSHGNAGAKGLNAVDHRAINEAIGRWGHFRQSQPQR